MQFLSLRERCALLPMYVLQFLQILTFLSAGLDQYLAILYPLEYSTKMTARVGWQLISATWVLGLMASALGVIQLVNGASPWHACRAAFSQEGRILRWAKEPSPIWGVVPRRALLTAIHVGLCYVIPMILITFLYLRIFVAAHRNSQSVRKTSVAAASSQLAAIAAAPTAAGRGGGGVSGGATGATPGGSGAAGSGSPKAGVKAAGPKTPGGSPTNSRPPSPTAAIAATSAANVINVIANVSFDLGGGEDRDDDMSRPSTLWNKEDKSPNEEPPKSPDYNNRRLSTIESCHYSPEEEGENPKANSTEQPQVSPEQSKEEKEEEGVESSKPSPVTSPTRAAAAASAAACRKLLRPLSPPLAALINRRRPRAPKLGHLRSSRFSRQVTASVAVPSPVTGAAVGTGAGGAAAAPTIGLVAAAAAASAVMPPLAPTRSVDSASSAGSSSISGSARMRVMRKRSLGGAGGTCGILLQQQPQPPAAGTGPADGAPVDTSAGAAVNGSEGSASIAGSSNSAGTPRRKCSFSSFSECRLLEVGGSDDEDDDHGSKKSGASGAGGDGSGAGSAANMTLRERHHTFLFSIEAPSPPPSPTSSLKGSLAEESFPSSANTTTTTASSSSYANRTPGPQFASRMSLPNTSIGSINPRDMLEVPTIPAQMLTAAQRRRRFSQVNYYVLQPYFLIFSASYTWYIKNQQIVLLA